MPPQHVPGIGNHALLPDSEAPDSLVPEPVPQPDIAMPEARSCTKTTAQVHPNQPDQKRAKGIDDASAPVPTDVSFPSTLSLQSVGDMDSPALIIAMTIVLNMASLR